jgi:GTP-binding protein
MPLFQNAKYAASVATLDDPLPASEGEIAFAGRSNAGKSSAINSLASRQRLAFVSKTPGRTQMINFFALGEERYLVDLPGYGFANVPGDIRSKWDQVLGGYLLNRRELRGMALIMDVRHPLTDHDLRMIEFMRPTGVPIHVLLTKADKVARTEARRILTEVQASLRILSENYSAQLFSSLKREGLMEAELVFAKWLGIDPPAQHAPVAHPPAKNKTPSGRINRRSSGIWKPKKNTPGLKGK